MQTYLASHGMLGLSKCFCEHQLCLVSAWVILRQHHDPAFRVVTVLAIF